MESNGNVIYLSNSDIALSFNVQQLLFHLIRIDVMEAATNSAFQVADTCTEAIIMVQYLTTSVDFKFSIHPLGTSWPTAIE